MPLEPIHGEWLPLRRYMVENIARWRGVSPKDIPRTEVRRTWRDLQEVQSDFGGDFLRGGAPGRKRLRVNPVALQKVAPSMVDDPQREAAIVSEAASLIADRLDAIDARFEKMDLKIDAGHREFGRRLRRLREELLAAALKR